MPLACEVHRIAGLCLACSVLLAGCLDSPEKKEYTPPVTNSDPPTANQLVRQQRVGGDPAKHSSIYDLLDLGDGSRFFLGAENGNYVAGRLGADGSSLWTRNLGFRVRGAARLVTPWSAVGTALVAVGSFDSDSDGEHDQGKVSLYGVDGTQMGDLTLATPGRRIWLHDLVLAAEHAESYEMIAVGGTDTSAVGMPFQPFAARIELRSDGSLVRGQERSYPELPWCEFRALQCDASSSPRVFYVGANQSANDTTITNAVAFRLSDSLRVDWRKDLVVTPGYKSRSGGWGSLVWADGVLYFAGSTETPKDDALCCWSGGLIAALSAQGQILWSNTISLTRHGEDFYECFVEGPHVYAAGSCAAYMLTSTKQVFGYGLLTKLDRASGAVLANMSFGDPAYASGFNALIVSGARAYVGGWTNSHVSGGSVQSWYLESDLETGEPAASRDENPMMPARVGDAVPVEGCSGHGLDRAVP